MRVDKLSADFVREMETDELVVKEVHDVQDEFFAPTP
jgi:hypothetical protein